MNKKVIIAIIVIAITVAAIALYAIDLSPAPVMPTDSSSSSSNDVSIILDAHDFGNWSEQEQLALTEMMRATAMGECVKFEETSPRVLEAYIELLENAGYGK